MASDAYKHSRSQRKKIERLFGEAKHIQALVRSRLRGITGAKDEFLLTATVQNLKRLAKLAIRPPHPCTSTAKPPIKYTNPAPPWCQSGNKKNLFRLTAGIQYCFRTEFFSSLSQNETFGPLAPTPPNVARMEQEHHNTSR
jgi:hypothetical protein